MRVYLLVACLLVSHAAAFLDTSQVRTNTINIPTATEESKITIKDSCGPPLPGSVRLGEEAYRAAPVLVPGSSWLAYVSQSAIGSWMGNCQALAFQNIDRA